MFTSNLDSRREVRSVYGKGDHGMTNGSFKAQTHVNFYFYFSYLFSFFHNLGEWYAAGWKNLENDNNLCFCSVVKNQSAFENKGETRAFRKRFPQPCLFVRKGGLQFRQNLGRNFCNPWKFFITRREC